MSTPFTAAAVQYSVKQRQAVAGWQQPLCRLGLLCRPSGLWLHESRSHPSGKLINDLNDHR